MYKLFSKFPHFINNLKRLSTQIYKSILSGRKNETVQTYPAVYISIESRQGNLLKVEN